MTTTVQASKKTTKKTKKRTRKIPTVESWRERVITNWASLKRQAETAKLKTPYDELIYIAFAPVTPKNKTQLKRLIKILGNMRYGDPLKTRFAKIYKDEKFTRTTKDLIQRYLTRAKLSDEEQTGIDSLLVEIGTLSGLKAQTEKTKSFLTNLQSDLVDYEPPSAVRVQAGMISAGQNVIFAGRDVHIVSKHYTGNKAELRNYLADVRTTWEIPATKIHSRANTNTNYILHELFTPPDIWIKNPEEDAKIPQKRAQHRLKSIERDLYHARQPVLELVATHPLLVVTGGPGTGKSSLAHFIATALSYACDPKAQKDQDVDGLELLGNAWIHGAVLPIHVNLSDFCADTKYFPKSTEKASATNLLKYLKSQTGSFGEHLEKYITQTDVETFGTFLIFDGLDEVYEEQNRIILRKMIENWANRFPQSRIMITSRTYAYREGASWRLSERFHSVELATFTWRQMKHYINGWYKQAASTRPSSFGGQKLAKINAQTMADDLYKIICENKSLLPIARNPLMLTLLTLIHEDYNHLPGKRAELYEQAVALLDRWNIPSATDTLHEKLYGLNLERMRAALKHIAYDLQSRQKTSDQYPTTIERGQLLDKLIQQQSFGDGLGAKIEDVLEYLETRNGIIVSDSPGVFRFPHLSIQEYLAACALIQFYDECPLPANIPRPNNEPWEFPQNIVALLKHDYYRWRHVALFAGSILAADKGQDSRWRLIDELLPIKLSQPIAVADVYNISIAAEIWEEGFLKARRSAQIAVRNNLIKCLEAILDNEHLDAPERSKNKSILNKLKNDLKPD